MRTLILAGGAGTRLSSVLRSIPKPMARIAGKPFLEYLLLQLQSWDMRDIVLCIGYLGDHIKNYFGDGKRWRMRIGYSEEETPLDTGGAIKKAMQLFHDEDFFVMNGDSYLNLEVEKILRFHLQKHALASIALAKVNNTERYGTVEITDRGEVQSFKEKTIGPPCPAPINGGLYVLHRAVLDFIPEGKVSLEKEVFPKLIGKGLYGIPCNGFFIDIGVPEDYERLAQNPELISTSFNLLK